MIDSERLRNWLMKSPRPDTVRITFEDEEQRIISRPGLTTWKEVAETISALNPMLIEAIAKDGSTQRATKASEISTEVRQRDNDRIQAPAVLATDPESARLCYVADIIHRAYQHATDVAFEKVIQANDTCFTRMAEIVQRVVDRSEVLERKYERAEAERNREIREHIEDALAAAEEKGEMGPISGLLQSFVGGMQLGSKEAPVNGGKQ